MPPGPVNCDFLPEWARAAAAAAINDVICPNVQPSIDVRAVLGVCDLPSRVPAMRNDGGDLFLCPVSIVQLCSSGTARGSRCIRGELDDRRPGHSGTRV